MDHPARRLIRSRHGLGNHGHQCKNLTRMDLLKDNSAKGQRETGYAGEAVAKVNNPVVAAHPVAPPTEVPRNKVHTGAPELAPMLKLLEDCITACQRCAGESRASGLEKLKYTAFVADACASICRTQLDWLRTLEHTDWMHLAMYLARVCASACNACELECSRHPEMRHCAECAMACRACSRQCLTFAA